MLPNLPYAFVFWFANKLGMAYRLAEGADVLRKIAGAANTLSECMSDIPPSFHPFDLLVGICGAAIIFAVVYVKGKNAKKYRKEVLCCNGCEWRTPKNTGGTSVCGTDAYRNLKGA